MLNDRIQHIREKLLVFHFTMEWRTGKTHCIADALSRAPYFPPDPSSEVDVFGVSSDDPSLDIIRKNIDGEYHAFLDHIRKGTDPCPPDLLPYRLVWDDLRVDNELLVAAGSRLVVPCPACSSIINDLHLSHSGLTKTLRLARQLFFWPHMTNMIGQKVKACSAYSSRIGLVSHGKGRS